MVSFKTGFCVVLASALGLAVADCPDLPGCDALGPPPIGNDCGVDPNDGSEFGIYALNCPCYVGEVLDCSATFTLTNGQTTAITTRTTVSYANTQSTIIYNFPQITNTAIQSGSPISVQFGARGANYPFVSQIYSPVPSIYYTDTTMTVTNTEMDTVTSTSTSTTTESVNVPQQTSTTDCTTGTATVTGSTSTVTKVSTITRKPRTSTVTAIHFTTTHVGCISKKSPAPTHRRRDTFPALVERQQPVNQGVIETLWCPAAYGDPTPTTYITATQVTTSTETDTETDTVTSTSTAFQTSLPTPLTTTVCNNVQATTTTTPTTTVTSNTTQKRSTTSVTRNITITISIFSHYPPKPCSTKPPKCSHKPYSHKALTLAK